MEKVLIRLMLAVLIMVFITPAAQSEMLVYEPFDYEVGGLDGNSGAFGLIWGWGDWWGDIPSQVVEGSLLHPMYEIEGIGNHAEIIDGGVGSGFATILADDGEDIWMSFLYQNGPGSLWGSLTMFFYVEESDRCALGLLLNNGTPGLNSLYTGEEETADVFDPDAVMWIVVKAETSGSSSTTEMAYMWVDPLPDTPPDTLEADVAIEYNIPHGNESDHFHWLGEGDPAAFRFDEVRIGRTFDDVIVQLPCENVSSPQPVNGAERVEIDLQRLNWKQPECVDDPEYNVYFGSDPNSQLWRQVVDHDTKTLWNIDETPLEYDTTYYWRVDVIEPNETGEIIYPGRAWRFTTLLLKPVFLTQPKSITVDPNSDVQFTVDVFNSNDREWYYSETPDGEGTLIPDVNSLTLDVPNVELADEGYYYCKAWNDDLNQINTSYSDRARLLIERPMAHWKFEDNLDDEVDPLNNGVPVGPVGYVAGIDGQAVLIDDPDYIQTTNDLGELTEFTISMWIKPDALSGEQTLLTATGSTDRGTLRLRLSEDEFIAEVIGGALLGGAQLTPAEWNHCVFIYDTSTRWSGLYLNGSPVNTASTFAAPLLPPLSIGSNDGLENYNGLIDDLRIYDYRISDLEVASLYTDFMPEKDVCLGNPAYDLSANCRVDLEDMALILSEWLKCHIVPTCLQ
jgi:hypothetical protein